MRAGQVSVEYMILTVFIMLVIVVPSVVFVYSFTNKGVYGTIEVQKVRDIGDGITNNAKQLYYLGLYSKKIVEYDMPVGVRDFFILDLTQDNKSYYYTGVVMDSGHDYIRHIFPSDVPLSAEPSADVAVSDHLDTDPGRIMYVPECDSPLVNCTYYLFKDTVTKPGYKKFKLETRTPGNVKVYITPVLG